MKDFGFFQTMFLKVIYIFFASWNVSVSLTLLFCLNILFNVNGKAMVWHTHPLVYLFVPQKERALSRNQKPESTQWLPTTRLLTYLRDWDDAKKRHCSAVHPALILHHPRVLHKPCKGSILGCLYKGWSIEWSSRRGGCVPHPFRRACSFVIFRVQHSCTHLIECTYITFNQQNNFFNNSLVCVCVCVCVF